MFVAGGHPSIENGKSIALYNPMLISVGVEEVMMKEGCLTYPFLFLNIKRPRKCVFKYEDSEGKLQEAHLDGMMSRICQHEYDHILGRNFVEHVSKFKLKRAEEKAKKLINQMRKSQGLTFLNNQVGCIIMTYSWKKGMSIDQQWESWQEHNPLDKIEAPDTETLKKAVVKDLSYVSAMDVKEYTLYQKWCEVHDKYPTQEVNSFFDDKPTLKDPKQGALLQEIKNNFWLPEDQEEYLYLEPELLWTDGDEVKSITGSEMPAIWNGMRTFLSTMKNNSNIGRNLNFLIRDKKTKKLLGVTCMSSDFLDLTPRDNYIGWERVAKTQRMINHTCIGSTIVPIQPLGYNLVGGKLLALLCLSDTVEKTWEYQYKDKLVGVTTTSLYGKTKQIPLSQYDRLKYWKKMGWTAGSVSYEPLLPTRKMIQKPG